MDIARWLEELDLARYAEAFRANDIDAALLPSLTDSDLKELGVASLGHRKLILKAIAAQFATPSPAPAEPGERRPVTVLFVDISGFTALSRRLDPEEVHRLLGTFFRLADRIVVESGGHVDKHIGDAVMATFGAPVARGDDARRAVAAAAAILAAMPDVSREVGFEIAAHAGLASGDVLGSRTGSAEHATYTVTGDAVNLAARLTDIAPPGAAILSEALMREVAPWVRAEDLGEAILKGLEVPVRAFRLVSLADRPAPSRVPFVGRVAERARVTSVLERAAAGAVVHIHLRGEAGVGKSRLLDEIVDHAVARGFAAHRTAFFDFGRERHLDPLGLLARLLAAAGSGPDPGHATLEPATRAMLDDLVGLPAGAEARALLAALGPEALTLARARALAHLTSRAEPVVPRLLVFEDVHWAPARAADLIPRLIEQLAGQRVGVLTTSRIAADPFAAEAARQGGAARVILDLGPLNAAESHELARVLAGGEGAFLEGLVARSGGNPLFLEHLSRHAMNATAAGLPLTLRSVILADIDRLDVADKALIRAAAVLGARFSVEALASVAGRDGIDTAGLEARRLLVRDGDERQFAHALIREAVHGSLIGSLRRDLHGRAARYFEHRDAGLFADHLALAGEAGAARAAAAAAEANLARGEADQALERIQAAQALARGDEAVELARLEGEALLALGRTADSIRVLEAALSMEASSPGARARVAIAFANALRIGDQVARALVILDEAEGALATEEGRSDLSRLHHLRGNLLFPLGRLDACEAAHQRALDLATAAGAPEAITRALGGLGDVAYARGAFETARRRYGACVERALEHGLLAIAAANAGMAAISRVLTGECTLRHAELDEAVQLAARIGAHRAQIVAMHALMMRGLWSGRAAEVAPQVEAAQALSVRIGAKRFMAENLAFLGEAERQLGRLERARALIEEALALCRETGMSYIGPVVLGYRALLSRDDPPAWAAALREADDLIAAGGLAHNALFFTASAMDACLMVGETARARSYADALERVFAAEPTPLTRLLAARGRALARHHDGDRSTALRAELRRCLAEAGRLGLATWGAAVAEALGEWGRERRATS